MRRRERGQSIIEMMLILPILLILILAVVEVGFAMRNYLLVMAANREGVRFAARGRFTDETIAGRIVSSGGVIQASGGAVPFLRTAGDEPNTAIIITHIPIREDGTVLTPTVYVSGTLPITDGVRAATREDTRVDLITVADRNSAVTVQVNDLREQGNYERLDNEIIVLEVFYAHQTLWQYDFMPIHGPWVMYTQSAMRVVSDARQRETQ